MDKFFTPNGDGINDEFCINVYNANSWELEVFDRYGKAIFQSAGTIKENKACMWDGSGVPSDSYWPVIRFKNNYGRAVTKGYAVSIIRGHKSASSEADSLTFNPIETQSLAKIPQNNTQEILFIASPNPSDGLLKLKFSNSQEKNIKIYNAQGMVCYQSPNIETIDYIIDLSAYSNGVYIISAEINNQVLTQKIILKK